MDSAVETASPNLSVAERVERIRTLYDAGQYLQAWHVGKHFGSLAEWPGVEARILAARLGHQLGASRLSDWLCRVAFREHPAHAEAKYFFAYVKLRRRGPYFAQRWRQENPDLPPGGSPEIQASWIALWGEVAASLRDFTSAEKQLQQAEAIDPDSAWLKTCAAGVLAMQDRYDEALATAREALELRPWYRPAVQQVGHLLTLRDRDGEAVSFLREASERLESASVCAELFTLLMELKQYDEAGRVLDRVETLYPLADKTARKWFASQRAEVAYYLGDIDTAIQYAEQSDSEFQKEVAKRLKEPGRREAALVTLPVGFVRQHHNTCGPATLSALSRFWQMPAEHLEVVDEICYDGTTALRERTWALEHGWDVREFTVTEDAARSLIDRGVPFTFTTVEPGGGHLQAIIGYDARRGTLIIRDPYWRASGEGLADKVLERYRPYGPRGMAMVPRDQGDKFDGLELPETEYWDLLFALDGALDKNRRADAEPILARLQALSPDHRLTLEARRRLAIYDSNSAQHLAAVEEALKQFPECPTLLLEKLSLMRSHASREDRLAIYKSLCAKKDTHPIFWQRYAEELRDDARQRDETLQLVRRAIRRWPTDPSGYQLLGHLMWDERRSEEALELYRIAACLNEKDESVAMSYFSAARWFKRIDVVLELLRDRFRRFGKKSSLPARTLAVALFQVERDEEALQVVEEAIQLRPDDGSLLLYGADARMQAGSQHAPRAHQLLEAARDKAPRTEWLSSSARLAEAEGRLHDALKLWDELLAAQPLNVSAHRAAVRLVASTESQAAALTRLRAAAERFPHFLPFFELWVEWMRDEITEAREPVLRRGLETFPENAWLHRELAFLLLDGRRYDEARTHTELAARLEPPHPAWRYLQADLLRQEGKQEEAQRVLREAVEQSVDNDFAVNKLMAGCRNSTERRAELAFIQAELVKQTIFGDGLLSFREHARGVLDDDELLSALQDALAARPDLWHAWSAVILQLTTVNRLDEAWELCLSATKRFPLVPRLWVDRSQTAHARLDEAGEEEALKAALEINPAWGHSVRALADLYERQQRTEEAEKLLRHAAARNPLDAVLQHLLAETLWRLERKEEAVEFSKRAVRMEPGYDHAWDSLHYWGNELGGVDPALEAARELTRERSGEARSWLVLARLLDKDSEREERHAAIAKALELNPQCVEAFDCLARTFAADGKWEEALAACDDPVWKGAVPGDLRARAAWIESERGRYPEAIERMEAVVAEDPTFFGAWSRLADWYQVVGDAAGYLRAAEALVRLNPQYEVALGYLAEARFINDDKAGAREAAERAFELEPRYEFAGNMLFDMHMEAEEFEEAAAMNARVRVHSESASTFLRQARISARLGRKGALEEALGKLAVQDNAAALDAAVTAAVDAPCWGPELEQVLEASFTHEKVNFFAAGAWMRLKCARNAPPASEQLRELPPALVEEAIRTYLLYLGERGDEPALDFFLRNEREWISAQTPLWAAVLQTLCMLLQYPRGLKWLGDWRSRTDLTPGPLIGVAETLRATGNLRDGREANRRALALADSPEQSFHHIFMATDAAIEGDWETVREHLPLAAARNGRQYGPDYQLPLQLATAALELFDAAPAQRPTLFTRLKRELKATRDGYRDFPREPERRRMYRKILQRMALLRGGIVGWFAWCEAQFTG